MLTDEQIAEALDLIDKRYRKVVKMYLEKVGATVNEIGHLTSSRINILVQLQKMGVSEQEIIRELRRTTNLTKKDIQKLYHKAAMESAQDAKYLYLIKHVVLDQKPLENLVQSMWMQTAEAMDNLSNTTVVSGAYRQIVDEAIQAVTMGVGDYNSTIRSSLRLIGRAGLQVEYESGYHKRLDTAIRQNILDGVRQVQQQAQKVIGEQIGADGVEISAHPNSAPDHEPVQGRQFPLEEFKKMQSGSDFEDADGKHYSGFERPITEWHCRHLVFYILLGVSKRLYTDEQLQQWEKENHKGCEIDGRHYTRYEATQLMRKIETEIRKEKDTAILAQASGDDVLRRKSQSNITALTAKYKYVAEVSGLRTRFEKTRVAGYSPKRAKEAEKAAVQYKLQKDTDIQRADADAKKFFGVSSHDDLKSILKRSTIKLKSGFSCFPDGDPLNENVKAVKPLEMYFDVALHGSPTAVAFGSEKINMSARLLASVIRHSEGYHGQKIRLLSCSTGKIVNDNYCFAEELANALGVAVRAPDDTLFITPKGTIWVGQGREGKFVEYTPNQRRRVK